MTETLVLVPGLGCTAELFRAQIEALGGERPIMVADHAQADSVSAIAADLLERAPDRFALAGLSMGGYVALEVMRQARARVSRLALLDTSARADTPERIGERERLVALAEAGRLDEVHAALWPRYVHPARLGDRALEATVRGMLADTGAQGFVRQQRALMARLDSRRDLPEIEVPVLVLVGAQDAATPPELSREIAEAIEWASLVEIPACGHLSTLERPDAVTDALRAWLAVPGA